MAGVRVIVVIRNSQKPRDVVHGGGDAVTVKLLKEHDKELRRGEVLEPLPKMVAVQAFANDAPDIPCAPVV